MPEMPEKRLPRPENTTPPLEKISLKFAKPNFDHLPICPLCGQKGPIYDVSCYDCYHQAEAERAEKKAIRDRLIRILGGPEAVDRYVFENYSIAEGNREAFEAAKAFNPKTDGLYFWGWAGAGKGHLCYAIASQAARAGKTVAIRTIKQIVRELRGKEGQEEEDLILSYAKKDVLVMDELGFGADSDYSISTACEILDRRWNLGLRGLVCASNHSLSDLAVKLNDDRLPSRINGFCKIIHVAPKDAKGKPIDWRMKK